MKLGCTSPCCINSSSHSLSPGKEAALPRPPPLGTGHGSFPSSGSSLSVAPRGPRFHHGEPLAMCLAVAVGMQPRLVVGPVPAAAHPPDHVVEVPPRLGRDG